MGTRPARAPRREGLDLTLSVATARDPRLQVDFVFHGSGGRPPHGLSFHKSGAGRCDAPNPGQCPDIFVHDRLTGATIRVSVDSSGVQTNGASTDPGIDANGSVMAFFSVATNLVPNDTNTCIVFRNPASAPTSTCATEE